MGRTLVGDSKVRASLTEWIGQGVENFGLIVGQLSSSSSEDYAAFLAPTLPPQEDRAEFEEEEAAEEDEFDDNEGDDDDEDSGGSADNKKKSAASNRPPQPAIVLSELTSAWVTHHSTQLTRLFTGGLDIIGIFVVCSPTVLAELTKSGKLKSFFAVLEKRTQRRHDAVKRHLHHHQFLPLNGDRYLMHGCTTTKAVSCKSLDVAAESAAVGGGQFKAADLKFQDELLKSWSRIDCRFGLDCVVDIPASKLSKCSLMKQIQQGLAPSLGELIDARIVLRPNHEDDAESHVVERVGTLPNPASCLADVGKSPSQDSTAPSSSSSGKSRKGGGRKGQGDAAGGKKPAATLLDGRNFLADVFRQLGNRNIASSSTVLDCATQMVFKGTVSARAHLHAKATVEESLDALKRDMIHSIMTRVELLCDDMLTEEDQETLPTGAVIYEMPVRIFAPLDAGDKTISIADFMFRDERKSDAVERIKEVTGKVVAEDRLETSVETFMPTELSAASSIESLSSHHSGNADSLLGADDDANIFQSSVDLMKKHYVSVLCLSGALASLFSAYLHFDDVF